MKENMKNYWKKNGFYVILTVALVVVLCISGVAGYRSGMKDKLAAENAAQFREAENVPEVFGESIEETTATGAKMGESETKAGETAEKTQEANASVAETFGEEAEMVWPVEGDVLKPFSADKTIYFETLDQYKCNPAMLIKADVNQEVVASFGGNIESVAEDSVNGTVVTVNMGNGYKAVYGQMKDLTVKEGDTIVKGQALGNVSEPTKYFTEEGCHLYFSLTKDEAPVNPQDYLS